MQAAGRATSGEAGRRAASLASLSPKAQATAITTTVAATSAAAASTASAVPGAEASVW